MRVIRILFLLYLGVVLVITLWPSPQSTDAPGWAQSVLDLAHGLGIPLTLPVLEASANVVMFVPFGVLGLPILLARGTAPLDGRCPWTSAAVVTAAGLALSACIETTQLAIPGRVSTLQDVAVNTLGAAIGAALVALVVAIRAPRPAPVEEPAVVP